MLFGSVLACAKYIVTCFRSSLIHFADFVSKLITLPQTVRLFCISLHSQAPEQQYTVHSMHYSVTMTVCIPFWTAWAQMSTFDRKARYRVLFKSLDHTLPLRTWYREIYGNIAREENVREGRIEKMDTHTDTQDNYCNPCRACAPRVNYYQCCCFLR